MINSGLIFIAQVIEVLNLWAGFNTNSARKEAIKMHPIGWRALIPIVELSIEKDSNNSLQPVWRKFALKLEKK